MINIIIYLFFILLGMILGSIMTMAIVFYIEKIDKGAEE